MIDSVIFDPTILASIRKKLCASVAVILFEMIPPKVTYEPGVAVEGVSTERIDKSGILKGKVILPCGLPPPFTSTTTRHLAAAVHLLSSDHGI
jgi:hypothetical protein